MIEGSGNRAFSLSAVWLGGFYWWTTDEAIHRSGARTVLRHPQERFPKLVETLLPTTVLISKMIVLDLLLAL